MATKRIILGVTGGIAAYKTPALVRRLRDRGAEVQVVMTRSAHEFVTATTLQAVSGRPVRDNLWDREAEAAMGHIELARWADLVLIAPATAEILSRLAQGGADDLLTTLCLATEAPLAVAPAMNHVMWRHEAVQANLETLKSRGARILGPGEGDQACGETGPGRMLEPDDIVAAVLGPAAVEAAGPLAGRTVMLTAGPTRESMDAVRFISNRSSGKMGYALAAAAQAAGARVILVSGPVSLTPPVGVEILRVESAAEMFAAVQEHVGRADIFIGTAAVADYRPAAVAEEKIKKTEETLNVALERTQDILQSVARRPDKPFTIGFAAETEKLRDYAQGKLKAKALNMIVANLVGSERGFDVDDNAVEAFWPGGERSFAMMPKTDLAVALIDLIAMQYAAHLEADTQTELPALATRD